MMCEVLLQGLEEAVSLERQLRECQLGGRIERQIWGGWGRVRSSLSHLSELHVISQRQMQGTEIPDLMEAGSGRLRHQIHTEQLELKMPVTAETLRQSCPILVAKYAPRRISCFTSCNIFPML